MTTWTNKEMTERRHDLSFVIKQAKDTLRDKNINSLCINRVREEHHNKMFTTAEASDLIYCLVTDSIYYSR